MNDSPKTTCPYCQASLLMQNTHAGDSIRCASCGQIWQHGFQPVATRVSRQAVASMICGAAALLCGFLTGIPAIILGVRALLAIRRNYGLHGRNLAITGITTGVIFGSCCLTYLLSIAWLMNEYESTTNPVRIEQLRSEICQLELPPELQPREGERLPTGMRTLEYANEPASRPTTRQLHIHYYPAQLGYDSDHLEQEYHTFASRSGMRPTASRRDHTIITDGKPLQVHSQMTVGHMGIRYQHYWSVIPVTAGDALIVYLEPPSAAQLAELEAEPIIDAARPEAGPGALPPHVARLFASVAPANASE